MCSGIVAVRIELQYDIVTASGTGCIAHAHSTKMGAGKKRCTEMGSYGIS